MNECMNACMLPPLITFNAARLEALTSSFSSPRAAVEAAETLFWRIVGACVRACFHYISLNSFLTNHGLILRDATNHPPTHGLTESTSLFYRSSLCFFLLSFPSSSSSSGLVFAPRMIFKQLCFVASLQLSLSAMVTCHSLGRKAWGRIFKDSLSELPFPLFWNHGK